MRFIEGFEAFSRFGYAMANLGDINGDGYDGKAAMQRQHFNTIIAQSVNTCKCMNE